MDREPHSFSNHVNDMIVIGRLLHARDFIKFLKGLGDARLVATRHGPHPAADEDRGGS